MSSKKSVRSVGMNRKNAVCKNGIHRKKTARKKTIREKTARKKSGRSYGMHFKKTARKKTIRKKTVRKKTVRKKTVHKKTVHKNTVRKKTVRKKIVRSVVSGSNDTERVCGRVNANGCCGNLYSCDVGIGHFCSRDLGIGTSGAISTTNKQSCRLGSESPSVGRLRVSPPKAGETPCQARKKHPARRRG
ncbi:unnamed protein product [Mortierella alpina]